MKHSNLSALQSSPRGDVQPLTWSHSPRAPRRALRVVSGLLLAALIGCVPEAPLDTDTDPSAEWGDAGVGAGTASIRDATPAPASFLLPLVQVFTWRGMCSGTLIARDRVLTAAHCVCTENLVGGNVCGNTATVRFRPHPTTGVQPPDIAGTVTYHPSYNPSWTDSELENDLAVVALASNAPTYITPMDVATAMPTTSTDVIIAGFGLTGSSCGGPSGALNFDVTRFDRIVDNGRILQWDDQVTCVGDSGGAITNRAGTILYGVHSSGSPTIQHGWTSKAIATQPYYSWIRGLTCSTDLLDRCSDKATMCRCGVGGADCDTNADCRANLRCAQNVGATFGYAANIDVCVPATGPIGGTCFCSDLGLANRCVAGNNQRSPGFQPRCNPLRETSTSECGGCTCQ